MSEKGGIYYKVNLEGGTSSIELKSLTAADEFIARHANAGEGYEILRIEVMQVREQCQHSFTYTDDGKTCRYCGYAQEK